MSGPPAGTASRDSGDVDALIADRYLDALLAAHGRGADRAPVSIDLQPSLAVRLAADRLALDLPRLHPSFRFEEALAGRLGRAAALIRPPLPVGGTPIDLPESDPAPFASGLPGRGDGFIRLRRDGPLEVGRPLLIGGAITSAAISIAGAAYVAWRFRHPQASPMVRAVRAVARTRLA